MAYNQANAPGITAAGGSTALTQAAQYVTTAAQTNPAVNYEFLTNSSGGWFDAMGYNWISFTIMPSGGVSGGVLTFECTNDTTNAPSGIVFYAQDDTATTPSHVSSVTLSATQRQYEAPISARYIRVRVSTAVTGGTVSFSATLKQAAAQMGSQIISVTSQISGSAQLGTFGLLSGSLFNNMGSTFLGTSSSSDLNGVVITTTGTSAAIGVNGAAPAAVFYIVISTASGTSPTLDYVIQESYDGVNYSDLYHFERITAVGTYTSPTLRINGSTIRYSRTVGGTSPSFTVSAYRNQVSANGQNARMYLDRSVNPNTLSSTTASYLSHGTTQAHIAVASGTAASPCTIALQGSDDNSTWWTIASVNTVASSVVQSTTINVTGKWIRATVTNAGSSQTLNYIQLSALST